MAFMRARILLIGAVALLAAACGSTSAGTDAASSGDETSPTAEAAAEATESDLNAATEPNQPIATSPPPASDAGSEVSDAQDPTCSLLDSVLNGNSAESASAALDLQAKSAPNPPGIDASFDTFAAFDSGATAPLTYEDAVLTLLGYYGGICPLILESDYGLETDGTSGDTTDQAQPAPTAQGCAPGQIPNGGTYEVTNIADNDPDGGLVAHSGPGVGAPVVKILSEFAQVTAGSGQAACAVIGASAWWNVTLFSGQQVWVNASYLGPASSEDYFDAEVALLNCGYRGDEDVCANNEIFGIEIGNSYSQAPSTALVELCRLNDLLACAELGFRGEILDANHQAFVQGIVLDLEYNCVTLGFQTACNLWSFYGGATTGVDDTDNFGPEIETGFDLELAQVACVYQGDQVMCDWITELFGFGPGDNYGLGNSLSQTPTEFLQADCDAGLPLACAELAIR